MDRYKKKCKECGGTYDTRDKQIIIKINHKDIEALEDRLFCELTPKQWKAGGKKIHKIWKQICDGEEKWGKKK